MKRLSKQFLILFCHTGRESLCCLNYLNSWSSLEEIWRCCISYCANN